MTKHYPDNTDQRSMSGIFQELQVTGFGLQTSKAHGAFWTHELWISVAISSRWMDGTGWEIWNMDSIGKVLTGWRAVRNMDYGFSVYLSSVETLPLLFQIRYSLDNRNLLLLIYSLYHIGVRLGENWLRASLFSLPP